MIPTVVLTPLRLPKKLIEKRTNIPVEDIEAFLRPEADEKPSDQSESSEGEEEPADQNRPKNLKHIASSDESDVETAVAKVSFFILWLTNFCEFRNYLAKTPGQHRRIRRFRRSKEKN